jgi:hypothetical protein
VEAGILAPGRGYLRRGCLVAAFLLFSCLHTYPTSSSQDISHLQPRINGAVDYLTKRFNPSLSLICESDDPGKHWLAEEFTDFKWGYRQTYWLYSDNLFAAYALEPFRPDISDRIKSALRRYSIPPSGLFEVVTGDHIPTIRDAVDYIVESSTEYVIMARRHDSSIVSYGLYADLMCYRALQFFLLGRINEAHRLFRQAVALWSDKGLNDWSFTIVDGFYSNQKLALLLYTSRVLMMNPTTLADMERHLWGMQQHDGGLAALSDPLGKAMGSSNTETTALALLIYNDSLISLVQSRSQMSNGLFAGVSAVSFLFLVVTVAVFAPCLRRGKSDSSGH